MERGQWSRTPNLGEHFCFILCHFWLSFLRSPGISRYLLILKFLSVEGRLYTSGQIACHPQGSGDTKQAGVTQAVCTQLEKTKNFGHPPCSPEKLITAVDRRAGLSRTLRQMIGSSSSESSPSSQTAVAMERRFSRKTRTKPPGPANHTPKWEHCNSTFSVLRPHVQAGNIFIYKRFHSVDIHPTNIYWIPAMCQAMWVAEIK